MRMYNRTNENYNKKATTVNRQTSPVFIFYENILLKSSPSFPTAVIMDPLRAFCQAAERLLGPFTYLRARYFPPRAQKNYRKKRRREIIPLPRLLCYEKDYLFFLFTAKGINVSKANPAKPALHPLEDPPVGAGVGEPVTVTKH